MRMRRTVCVRPLASSLLVLKQDERATGIRVVFAIWGRKEVSAVQRNFNF